MNFIEYVGRRRVLWALLCLGMFSVSCTSTLADRESRDVVAATPSPAPSATAMPAPAPIQVAKAIPAEEIVATVNGKPITIWEFNARYAAMMRERFYHGKPPEGQAEAVRKEVIDLLIENALLVEEAERRGFKLDEAKFEQAAAAAEARYSAMPEWQKDREPVLSAMKEQIGRQSLIEQASKALREVPKPTPDEVRSYYEQNPEFFTEPEKLRLSVILLKVDPGAPKADLDKVREEAQGIYLRLKDGADFAELARQKSGDGSADKGGDLGYVHGGMMPEKLQEKIDKFQVGVVAEPIRVLEGIALYRLDEREAPILREFKDVESRAQELLKRDQQDRAWKEAISRLRGDARIEILVPIADDSVKQSGSPAAEQLIVTEPGNLLSSKPDAELTTTVSSDKQSDTGNKKDGKKKSSKKKKSKKTSSDKIP